MAERREPERNLCWELGLVQQVKNGEAICGDTAAVSWDHDDVQIVLSDGLGSGIQASIASTLTTALVSAMSRSRYSVQLRLPLAAISSSFFRSIKKKSSRMKSSKSLAVNSATCLTCCRSFSRA